LETAFTNWISSTMNLIFRSLNRNCTWKSKQSGLSERFRECSETGTHA